ncbi:MAG: putative fimbrial protein [Phycisphaerales bacterium]|nr:putative fimbrial protein [Phycisphaerales bacterium]
MIAHRTHKKSGFTLIEILIVVIILGILAAIVIPQFTSASNDARKSNVSSTLQTLRTQVELYKLQHNDNLPNLTAANGWQFLTAKTDVSSSLTPAANAVTFGPYMQDVPVNALTGTKVPVIKNGDGTAAVAGADYIYDYNSGNGTGRMWATTDTASGTIFVP